MKRIAKLLVLLGLLIILGASCQNTNIAITSSTPESLPNWWSAWLANPACKPPCWKNITPGTTTGDEAISILENTPEIKITFQTNKGVDWIFKRNKNEGGRLSISQDRIVRMIWLGSSSDQKLFVKIMAASYGEPEYVKPYDCREGMCSTALIYPDLGMFLSVFIENTETNNDTPKIEILMDTIVNRVYFIEPGIESFLTLYGLQESDMLTDWKGYGKYP